MPKKEDDEKTVSEDIYAAEDETSGSKAETSEEIDQEMEEGKKDEDVYSKEGRENLVEDGEISESE